MTFVKLTGVFLKSAIIFLLHHEKIAVFGQGKKLYFHLESGKNYPFSALLSGKKGVYFTKSQGKLFWGTAGNPEGDVFVLELSFLNVMIYHYY